MRTPILVSAVLAAGALAACTPRVDSTPPTVSYRVIGSDVSQANANAINYCQRYGTGARMMSYTNGTATYECTGASTAQVPAPYPTTVAPGPTSSAPLTAAPPNTVQCADFFHQDRPGGSDYHGPPVAGCPQR